MYNEKNDDNKKKIDEKNNNNNGKSAIVSMHCRMLDSMRQRHFVNLIIHCVLNESTLQESQFGHFHDICLKYTPSKCVEFNLSFTFGVLALYFHFHKVSAM